MSMFLKASVAGLNSRFGIEKVNDKSYVIRWIFVETFRYSLSRRISESILKSGRHWSEDINSVLEWIFYDKMRWII